MSITVAHEGVIAHPRRQLWVVDPDAARSNPDGAVDAIRARAAAHRRSRLLVQAGGFAAGAALGSAVAGAASYNPVGLTGLSQRTSRPDGPN